MLDAFSLYKDLHKHSIIYKYILKYINITVIIIYTYIATATVGVCTDALSWCSIGFLHLIFATNLHSGKTILPFAGKQLK